jgi:hypothetical protein
MAPVFQVEAILQKHPAPSESTREIVLAYIEKYPEDQNCEDRERFIEFVLCFDKEPFPPGNCVRYFRSPSDLEVTFLGSPGKVQLIWNEGLLLNGRCSSDSDYHLKGKLIFVISKDCKVYCHGDGDANANSRIKDPPKHHSSFLSGEDVLFAGELETRVDGTLESMSNESGHYLPGNKAAAYALAFFQENGVDLSLVEYKECLSLDKFQSWDASQFLESMKSEGTQKV